MLNSYDQGEKWAYFSHCKLSNIMRLQMLMQPGLNLLMD